METASVKTEETTVQGNEGGSDFCVFEREGQWCWSRVSKGGTKAQGSEVGRGQIIKEFRGLGMEFGFYSRCAGKPKEDF